MKDTGGETMHAHTCDCQGILQENEDGNSQLKGTSSEATFLHITCLQYVMFGLLINVH